MDRRNFIKFVGMSGAGLALPASLMGSAPAAPAAGRESAGANIDPSGYGMARQVEIYSAGARGIRPERPVSPDALEAAAKEAMTLEAFGYVPGDAGPESTMAANREALERLRIVPRMLRDNRGPAGSGARNR